jgi:hypothetical protein
VDDWEKRYANLLERIMATAASGGKPEPLQEQLRRLLAERDGAVIPTPKRKRNAKS